MTIDSEGSHIFLDYTNYVLDNSGDAILDLLQRAAAKGGAREVHAHVEIFDGTFSPTGFAAVVLIDESHITAHCYYEKGLLAIDIFTCGGTDPDIIADIIHSELMVDIPILKLMRRNKVERFIH